MLESFSFTEDKRKEVRDNIEERVRLLEDEHVSFFLLLCCSLRVYMTYRDCYHRKKKQYENILKDTSLSEAIRTLETKAPGVSPPPHSNAIMFIFSP